MTPAEFRALKAQAVAPAAAEPSRRYQAVTCGETAETFLALHARAGEFNALPYSGLQFINGDDVAGTSIKLVFNKMRIVLDGRQLGAVLEAIRTRRAAHLYEYDGSRFDPPESDEPVISALEIGVSKTKEA